MSQIASYILFFLLGCNSLTKLKLTDSTSLVKEIQSKSSSQFIPKGYNLIKEYSGDLNNDGLEDKLLLIELKASNKKDNSSKIRPLLILLAQKNKTLKEVSRNDFLIFDDEATAYGGDAFNSLDGIKIENGKFTISYFYHIFNELSSQQFTFKYVKAKNNWFLIKHTFHSEMDTQGNVGNKTIMNKTYTKKNYGEISFDHYRKEMTTNQTSRREIN